MTGKYTLTSIAWRKRKRNHRLLFGTPDRSVRLGWHNRLAAFLPDQIFGYERWRANKYGTIEWQIFILQAQKSGQPVSQIPGVFPGACVLASAHGKPNAKRMLSALDGLRHKAGIDALSAETWIQFGLLFDTGFDAGDLMAMAR